MKSQGTKIISVNRKIPHDYEIIDEIEAGISLKGWEVKSIRNYSVDLKGGWVRFKNGEAFLEGVHIAPYSHSHTKMEVERERKLLLKKHEIIKLNQKIKERGLTLLPYKIYINKRGWVKVLLTLCRSKRKYDKREEIKRKEVLRRIEKSLKRRRVL